MLAAQSSLCLDPRRLGETSQAQAWIYNIVLRMVYLPQDAEDATQEILVKLMTKLSTFAGKISFRTWWTKPESAAPRRFF